MNEEETGNPRGQIVHLVHGILTRADWVDTTTRLLEEIPGVEVEVTNYGYFDLLSFLPPGPWRRRPIKVTARNLLRASRRALEENKDLSVIAHSNGTYATYKALIEHPTIKLHHLVLCGAIIGERHDLARIDDVNIQGMIVNDYGTRDAWPAVAASVTWGYDSGGTYKIGVPARDRRHPFGHSEFFSEDFVRKFWLPLFEKGEFVRAEYTPAPSHPKWFRLLNIQWRWVILFLIAAATAAAIAILGPLKPTTETSSPGANPTSNPPVPTLTVTPEAATFQFQNAVFGGDGSWKAFDVYDGQPRNLFSIDYAEMGTPPIGQGRASKQDFLSAHGLVPGSDRFRKFRNCMSSPAYFRTCDADLRLAVMSLADVMGPLDLAAETFELGYSLERARENWSGLQGATRQATDGADNEFVITVKNVSEASATIYGVAIRQVSISYGQGDGYIGAGPVVIKAAQIGSLKILDSLMLNCKKNSDREARIDLADPLSVPAGEVAPLRFMADTNLTFAIGSDIFDPESAERGISVREQCEAAHAERKRQLNSAPKYLQDIAADLVVPFSEDGWNASLEIVLLLGGGREQSVGMFNVGQWGD